MSETADWVTVAIVLRAHGLGGALVLKPLTRTPDEFLDAPLEEVRARLRGRLGPSLKVTRLSIHKGQPLIYFEGYEDRTQAETLVGYELVIPESERWDLEDGQFYFDELEGLAVVEEGTGRSFGPVRRVQEGGGHDYLVIAHPDKPGQELLVPFIQPDCVRSVDLEAGQVVVALPEGLLDL